MEEPISFSQVDITDRFGDDQEVGPVATTPLNATIDDPESLGLPPQNADDEEVYRVAARLSALHESVPIPNDGVYCPVCHIANVDLQRLRMPCPQCRRPLLQFGWD